MVQSHEHEVRIRRPSDETMKAVQLAADGGTPDHKAMAQALLEIQRQADDITKAMEFLANNAVFTEG